MRVAVIGAGIVGAAVTRELIMREQDVVCFEMSEPLQARSAGDSRIFRRAHARPELVEQAVMAQTEWQRWSDQYGRALIDECGLVVNGADAVVMSEAMQAVGIRAEITDVLPPGVAVPGHVAPPVLFDERGGAIDLSSTRSWLLQTVAPALVRAEVAHIEQRGQTVFVRSDHGDARFDRVLIAAGGRTADLARQVSISVPFERVRHTRFTFPVPRPRRHACWIERAFGWRPDYATYGLSLTEDQWSVGGSPPEADTLWDLGPDEVRQRSLALLTEYLRDVAPGVDPSPLSHIDCDFTPTGTEEGFTALQNDSVTAFWGDNLFKFAPLLGARVARIVTGEMPAEEFSFC